MENPRIGPFTEAAEFRGIIINAVDGGNALILLEQAEGEMILPECSDELVRALTHRSYDSPFRLLGYATSERGSAGQWKLVRFRATGFRVLRTEDLATSVARIRSAMPSGGPRGRDKTSSDPDQNLRSRW
jgi:hypothetical protein